MVINIGLGCISLLFKNIKALFPYSERGLFGLLAHENISIFKH